MAINTKLLPIKAHFFFFMSAMGPILPQLPVFGKELGISPAIMGSITGILPVSFLIAKPLFGMIVDIYRNYRKCIFMLLITTMGLSYSLMVFIPARITWHMHEDNVTTTYPSCNSSNATLQIFCKSKCLNSTKPGLKLQNNQICFLQEQVHMESCPVTCWEDLEDNSLYESFTFWSFVVLLSIGTIGFNVVNSISDAICCDVIGDEYDYGKQRVWGTIGFGITALLSGYIIDLVSGSYISYVPAFIVMAIFTILDLIACCSLELPIIESPKHIWDDLKDLAKDKQVITFICFAVLAGIIDSFMIYFLFWYIEDMALEMNTKNIKLLEGLVVAAETLGGEVLFFSISGKILERFGHVHCFSMCFISYALRLGFISFVPNPWWILPIEFVFQGPTYAMTYTTIVAYANELSPPGATATMQGIAAGMDDGVGYAIGSVLGGFLYKFVGGTHALQIFSLIAVISGISHGILHKTFLKESHLTESHSNSSPRIDYDSPEEAYLKTMSEDA